MGYKKRLYFFSRYLKPVFIAVALAIVCTSMLFSNRLAKSLAVEEKKKIEIWAEATRQFVLSDTNTDIDFLWKIIEENTTIPVVIIDENDRLMSSRNFKEPKTKMDEFYNQEIERLKQKREAIVIQLEDERQYIYYDDSVLLRQLYYFPYWQLGVIFVFLLIGFWAFSSSKKAEQNQVWVGLSKETAHQLGTPISSLLAWVDLLKLRHADDKLIDEMMKDVNRLRIIAERFSKIGSTPDLSVVNLNDALKNAVQYMSKRSSQQVSIGCTFKDGEILFIPLNIPLFEWVIENLCKNAIDAMDGVGSISIDVGQTEKEVWIDVKDTGKGLDRRNFKTVFKPGYTTKSRGWGLGLSLAKRIVEEYHGGKIFVKQSELNVGTVFRIVLNAK
ncbi:MAG: HAMP domain-containing histidine kinase [Prevotellaceae bacterium]|jgi:hypothetical protein|nr:HAMP domain-containing histidine kinase [Prevotellaceae bacterium]